METKNDNVNHPSHYTSGVIEVIDYIEDQELGYHLGNVVKYICRAGKKDPDKEIEDLKKARWYLDRYIRLLESKTDKRTRSPLEARQNHRRHRVRGLTRQT